MRDSAEQKVRERLWVEKFDHSTDPPTLVERRFVEDGELKTLERLSPPSSQQEEDADGRREEEAE